MIKVSMFMMKFIPQSISDKMKAPMLERNRLLVGANHPSIKMNLTNLKTCAANCGTCPSSPGLKDEALYCATGKSSVNITKNGCNCVLCDLYDKCRGQNAAYFCIHGACKAPYKASTINHEQVGGDEYLNRFLPHVVISHKSQTENASDALIVKPVQITFTNDKTIEANSNETLLEASLEAGINHTHVCGGRAKCSTCRVLVTEGLHNCLPRNKAETDLAELKGFPTDVRLACQTKVKGDITARRLVLDDEDISEAMKDGTQTLGEAGREIQTAVLFSDIRSFTSFSEKALPYDIIHILNRYYEAIGEKIDAHDGFIDKYMGDGIMVLFGLTEHSKANPSLAAVKTASEMLKVLKEFNVYLKKHFDHEFQIGIGIHTGPAVVGSLGYRKKKEFTALGDSVNTASRIESLTKKTKSKVLVCASTFENVEQSFEWKRKFRTKVKGKAQEIVVYEPDF